MVLVILFSFVVVLITLLILIRRRKRSNILMVVLGSGGHTGEMFSMLDSCFPNLSQKKDGPEVDVPNKPSLGTIDSLLFVTSANDSLSLQRLSSVKLAYNYVSITRARDVHESLLSAIPKIISSSLQSLFLLYDIRPVALLTNGPGVCVPLLIAARLLSPQTECIFVESVCRTRTLSLTGKILYRLRLVKHFFVQWPRLHQLFPRSRYIGLLV